MNKIKLNDQGYLHVHNTHCGCTSRQNNNLIHDSTCYTCCNVYITITKIKSKDKRNTKENEILSRNIEPRKSL